MSSSASPALMARAAVMTRIHAGAAEAVDGGAGDADRQAGEQQAMRATSRLSSPAWLAQPKTTSSTASQSTAAWRAISAFERDRAEIVGANGGERAAEAADRRADEVADEGFGHLQSSGTARSAMPSSTWRGRAGQRLQRVEAKARRASRAARSGRRRCRSRRGEV